MSDETSAVSPTGLPWLPAWAPKAAAFAVGLAVLGMQALPSHTIAYRACEVVVQVGSVLGIVSQGARKKE